MNLSKNIFMNMMEQKPPLNIPPPSRERGSTCPSLPLKGPSWILRAVHSALLADPNNAAIVRVPDAIKPMCPRARFHDDCVLKLLIDVRKSGRVLSGCFVGVASWEIISTTMGLGSINAIRKSFMAHVVVTISRNGQSYVDM